MVANWLYLASAVLFAAATIVNMTARPDDDAEDDDAEPWGVLTWQKTAACVMAETMMGWEE